MSLNQLKMLRLLTRIGLCEYDASDPPMEGTDPHPLSSLVLPLVVGIPQLGAVQSATVENTHQCEGAICLFFNEGTSCT